MTRQLLPLVTGLLTIVGMWLAGSKDWRGWAVGLLNQTLWLWFIIAFSAWGLLPLLVALVFIYSRNLLRWKREPVVTLTTASGESMKLTRER